MIALVVPEILPAAELANLELDITEEEILTDLAWPGPPPGEVSARRNAPAVAVQEGAHVS
jgi:hypothetical protein